MRSALFEIHEKSGVRMVEADSWEAPDVFTTVEAEYAAAHEGAVVYDSSPLGRLRLTGATRVDFLQRMSTNDMNALASGQGAATILTTPTARIVDRVIVYLREADALLITSRGAQAPIAAWLKKYIFFNDDVQVRDASGEWWMLSIYGAKAAEVVSRLAGSDAAGLRLHAWHSIADGWIVARADPIAGDGFHVLAATPERLSSLWQAAIAAGAAPIGEQALEVLRIESGRPRFARELSEEYIPLEVGLWADVSFTKGCYVGQEIIARMESRHRLAKQMIGLRSSAPIRADSAIHVDGTTVGHVTSSTPRPQGDSIALGFIKPAYATAGARVSLDGEIVAEVIALPAA